MSKFALSGAHPAAGTLIDNDTLELLEIVGTGGYGVVYKAVETGSLPGRSPRTFAVKVLSRTDGRRNSHIREAALHYHVSGHPHIIDLYQVLEDDNFMYFVMQYARSKDLFDQILHKAYFLGNDHITKVVFLQLLEAVSHLHHKGVYHRDLKPENILCLDEGHRIAISDFGLATKDEMSVEFRTGSIYHMSPECQIGRYASDAYSPMSNDVWSLGIVLLNMVTGRNPWKSATLEDSVFQSYCRSPHNFFSSVLPVSPAFNRLLVQVLNPDWKRRMGLDHFRQEVENMDTFYSADVVFQGSLARCPWEVDSSRKKTDYRGDRKPTIKRRPVPPTPGPAGAKPLKVDERAPAPSAPIPEAEPSEVRGHGTQTHVEHSYHRSPPPPPSATTKSTQPAKAEASDVQHLPDSHDATHSQAVLVDHDMSSLSPGTQFQGPLPPSTSSSFATTSPRHVSASPPFSQLCSASSSSTCSFPETPVNATSFLDSHGKNKVDVKIMASTQGASSHASGRHPSSVLISDFSTYMDLASFSHDLDPSKDQPDHTMLSPAPSQYSLHEAFDYEANWFGTRGSIESSRPFRLNTSHRTPSPRMSPEILIHSPSQPINIVGARTRHSQRRQRSSRYTANTSNTFNHHRLDSSSLSTAGYRDPFNSNHHRRPQAAASRYSGHLTQAPAAYSPVHHPSASPHHPAYPPPGRVAAMRKVWERKLPSRPMRTGMAVPRAFYGTSPVAAANHFWFADKFAT